jgi:hypothetical protein
VEVSVVVVRLRRPSEMPTVVTTRRRWQPASCRASLVEACPSADRGCEPHSGISPTPIGEVFGFLGPLFDELNGNRALDAPVLALEATG